MTGRRGILIVIAFLLAGMLIVEPAVVSAATLSEIRQEIEEKEKKLEEGRSQESSLASQVTELEKKINELEGAIAESQVKLEALQKEVDEAQKKVDTQSKNLNGRLRNMYKNSSVGYLDVLLKSESFSDFLTNLDLVKIIYSSDQDILKELEKAHQELEKKKNEVEELQA